MTRETTMSIASEVAQTWPDAIVDVGPIQLLPDYWGVVGLIPYDGHVVLAVSRGRPKWGRSRAANASDSGTAGPRCDG
jgi:hypothetical protein